MGHLTQDDMIQLETVKRRCYYDYASVEQYLHNMPVNSLLPKNGQLLDQDCDPLSSSNITNTSSTIEHEIKPKFAAKTRFC